MGKKKIANKFASVKRIISSQDHRMCPLPNPAKRTKPKRKNTIVNVNKPWPDRLPTTSKSANCTPYPI